MAIVGYKILRSHDPEKFFIALAIGLPLKSNTAYYIILLQNWHWLLFSFVAYENYATSLKLY